MMLVMGLYWGLWLLADGFNSTERATVVFVVFIAGTLGFACIDFLNRFLVYRSWINNYLDVVSEHTNDKK